MLEEERRQKQFELDEKSINLQELKVVWMLMVTVMKELRMNKAKFEELVSQIMREEF